MLRKKKNKTKNQPNTKRPKFQLYATCRKGGCRRVRYQQMGIWGRSGRAASDTRDRRSRGPEPRALLLAPPPFPPQVTTLFSSSEPLRPQLTALSSDAGTRCPEEAASLTPNHRPRKSPPRPPQKRFGVASPLNAPSLTELARVRS